MTTKQARQGDVFFLKINKLPEGLKIKQDNILVYGESTGHAHRVKNGTVLEGKDDVMYIRAGKNTQVVHEEHGPITLTSGIWAVTRQREYLSRDMVRVVVD